MAGQIKLEALIGVKVDPKSIKAAERDLEALQKNLSRAGIDWTKLAKTQQVSAQELINIGRQAAALGGKISKGAQDSAKKMIQLGKAMQDAMEEADEITKKMSETSDPKERADLSKRGKAVWQSFDKLSKAAETVSKSHRKYSEEIEKAKKVQERQINTLKKHADVGVSDIVAKSFRGVLSGISKGGLAGAKESLASAGGGMLGIGAKAGMKAAAGSEAAMAAMGSAVTAIGGAVAVIGVLVKLLMAASNHMTNLNKALLTGSTLGNEFGKSADAFRMNLNTLTKAAVNSSWAFRSLGMDTEEALKTVAAFSNEATGSLGQTIAMFEGMGLSINKEGSEIEKGMEKFVTSARVYGMALGMSAEETAKMMGSLVSEIGISSQNVLSTMNNIVKTAATSGMPVKKFMDIFHQTIPSLDLFTNRIEELTGTMKLLSKSMDPRAVKGFISAMGRGFDQLDFKQRLKMAFVIGPQKVANILKKDFMAAGKGIQKQFESAGIDITAALKAADPVKAMAAVAAKASALGVSPAAIGEAQKLARDMASLKTGNVLDLATAMRGAGLYARMKMMKDLAGRFTGGSISGLGEHVAAQLGVSGEQYKAVQALSDNMAMYQESMLRTGRTSSKSLNENLRILWRQSKKQGELDGKSDEQIEQAFRQEMKELAKNRDALEDRIMEAASLQIANSEDAKESMEDLAIEQVNATMSIEEKLESIVGYFLEKIYSSLSFILDALNDVWGFMMSDDKEKYKQQRKEAKSEKEFAKEAADVAATRQAIIAKQQNLTKDQVSSMKVMLSTLKEAAHAETREDALKVVKPLIDNIGDISLKSFDAQKTFGQFFRRNEQADKEFRAALEEIEKAKDEGEKQRAKEKARDIAIKALSSQDVSDFINTMGSVAESLAASGLKLGAGANLEQIRARKLTQSQQKQAKETADTEWEVAKELGDVFPVVASKANAGIVVPAAATPTTATSAAAATPVTAALPPEVTGVPVKTPPKEKSTDYVGMAKKALPFLFPAYTLTGYAAEKIAKKYKKSSVAETAPAAAVGVLETSSSKQTKIMEGQSKSQEEMIRLADADYQNSSDLLSLMKKGVRLEDSWTQNKFANVLKSSTLESFRTALLEFAVVFAKIQSDTVFAGKFADYGKNIMESGLTLRDFGEVVRGDEEGIPKLLEAKSHATGLMSVPYDNYLASLHKGEVVLPASTVRSGISGGVKTTNVVVYATGVPASEVVRRIGELAVKD